MNWNEYQVKALRTMAEQGAILTRLVAYGPRAMQLDNGARGLSDEVGEVNAAVKKYIEYGKPLDVANIKEEVGDCLWRLTQICHAVGLSLQECAEGNINKLAVRYPEAYSDHLAAEESRDRASEAQAVATTVLSEVVSEPIVQNGNGFGEPPEVDESVSRHSYTKACCKCGRSVHKTSQTNPPTCSACYVPAR